MTFGAGGLRRGLTAVRETNRRLAAGPRSLSKGGSLGAEEKRVGALGPQVLEELADASPIVSAPVWRPTGPAYALSRTVARLLFGRSSAAPFYRQDPISNVRKTDPISSLISPVPQFELIQKGPSTADTACP